MVVAGLMVAGLVTGEVDGGRAFGGMRPVMAELASEIKG